MAILYLLPLSNINYIGQFREEINMLRNYMKTNVFLLLDI